ncbi:hypothetical protein HPB52_024220 [Rhipicephalus sanguineus]|uniref:Uncharacterized protein n=1 Tax=Rhipicephalus sanguineus TaxID=34632 RepID=A0A9D4YSC0_RHISA|nr:hypothetical protein HPB52_024220 [Rhipicephalus sanguineus]
MEASSTKVVENAGESDGGLTSSMPLPEDRAAHDESTGDDTGAAYHTMVRELGLMRATAHVVSIDTWKGRLDFERACAAAVPGERCWLSGELTAWNRVLNSLEYELVETRPGSVRLQKADCDDCDYSRSVEDVYREAAVLISWLLEHHLCIEELSLISPSHYGYKAPPVPSPIRLRPSVGSNLDRYFRQVKIDMADHFFSSSTRPEEKGHLFALEGLNTVCGIEKLKVASSKVTFKFAAELESLLRRNASTLKAVKITKAILPRNVDYALRCLVNCESLTLYPYFSWGRRVPSLVSVAQLLRTTSALKNLSISICPINRKKQLTTIAEAIKANTSLTKLSVCSGEISCSPEPIFAALQANGTLKELQLQKCNIGVYSAQALAKALCKNTSLRRLSITESTISAYSMQQLGVALRVNSTLEEIELSGRRSLPFGGIVGLCSSLAENKTLKKLTLGKFRATEQERLSKADLAVKAERP